MARKSSKQQQVVQRFHERYYLERPGRPPLISESWTKDSSGNILRYGLAYIDFSVHTGDNGRVLGYDNGHQVHERHFMGRTETIEFSSYESLAEHFLNEVDTIRKGLLHVEDAHPY
jgi:hypothetical protein